MKLATIALCAVLFVPTAATPQCLELVSSFPADGAVGVPLQTTVSFTFSLPLDTSQHYSPLGLPIQTLGDYDSVSLGQVSYSPDLRTLNILASHTPNTDFGWVILCARSAGGDTLCHPYHITYATSPAGGALSVSGTITVNTGIPEGAVVLLLKNRFGTGRAIHTAGSVVLLPSGSYTIDHVRDGVFWPIFVKDSNGDCEINPVNIDAFGFYDPEDIDYRDSIVVAGQSLTGIDIHEFGVTYRHFVSAGWNMISLPRGAADPRLSAVYPTANSLAFTYVPGSGYIGTADTLRRGVGYWLKFPVAQEVVVPGALAFAETIGVAPGWNMIGGISITVDTAAVLTDPPGIRTSPYYEYDGTYSATNRIRVGRGYWVKVNQAGSIILSQ